MRIRIPLAFSVLVALAGAAFGAAGASAKAGSCSSGQVVRTPAYVFKLELGPVETMYTPAQVKAKHPKTGEVMLSGSMTGGMAAMTVSTTGERHLEVHICSPTGAVVTGAHPSIVVSDPTAKTMNVMVPVATMEGIGEGVSDYHYGNNVALTTGHHITVTVTLKGFKAVFHATVPAATM